MEIFLVRHGQTDGNVAHRHQAADTPLNELGKKQALSAAKIIKELKPTHVVTSNLVRAIQTAEAIGEACDLIPDTNAVFRELERPVHLRGHYHRSSRSFLFYFQWYFRKIKTDKVGGESYDELLERIDEAKKALAKYPPDARVVVVSHAVFITMFLAHLCRKKPIGVWKAVTTFPKILMIKNTSFVKVNFDTSESGDSCAWSVDR